MRVSALPNPQPDEKLLLVLRRHWFVALGIVFVTLVLFIVPIGVYYVLSIVAPNLLSDPVITPILVAVAVLFYLAVWLFSFTDFIDYYLDVWIITTGRVINIEQQGLFKRTESELNLSSIQDVTAEIRGPIQTVFGFGNVYVQTAAEKERFILKKIPHPEQVQETIMHIAEEDRLRERRGTIG